jgi:hypothetical protein
VESCRKVLASLGTLLEQVPLEQAIARLAIEVDAHLIAWSDQLARGFLARLGGAAQV